MSGENHLKVSEPSSFVKSVPGCTRRSLPVTGRGISSKQFNLTRCSWRCFWMSCVHLSRSDNRKKQNGSSHMTDLWMCSYFAFSFRKLTLLSLSSHNPEPRQKLTSLMAGLQ